MSEVVAQKSGSLSQLKNGSDEIQKRIDMVKDQVEKAVSQTLSTYQAVTFKSQVVEGENFFVKVFIGSENKCIHVKIMQLLPPQVEYFNGVQQDKTFLSPIEYF